MIKFTPHFSLVNHNTFGVDQNCALYTSITNVEDLKKVLKSEPVKKWGWMVLGGGSNILITQDLDKVVIKLDIKGVEKIKENDESVWVRVGAGVNWHQFVLDTLDKGYYGLENLSLIPGNVGTSPIQNIGAYGVEIKDFLEEVEGVETENLETVKMSKDECSFGYRDSIFKRNLKGKFIITHVTYRLSKTPNIKTDYGVIKEELTRLNCTSPSPKDVSNAVINIRRSKLPDPAKIGNSGSFFKNPIVIIDVLEQIKKDYPDVPNYPIDSKHVKIAAGWLIEKAGWKGKIIDNKFGVHNKQALVLVNYGGATGMEIYNLSSDIIKSVNEKFKITLEREVNIL